MSLFNSFYADKDDVDEEKVDKADTTVKNNQDWSFSSSFLYSLSLITTMGKNINSFEMT